ncbi:MAG: FtsX-like permease family protein [Lachnospiraceae bacterium]|nr:FtsX-like permease family protein [Lachnospiraceae bacterium]
MQQIIRITINNIKKTKVKAVIIVILMSLAMFISSVAFSLYLSSLNITSEKVEELEAKVKIKIMPFEAGGKIPLSAINHIETMEGVSYVLPEYNLPCMIEDPKSDFAYSITVDTYDFKNNIFMSDIDLRNEDVSGILLPDVEFETYKVVTMKNFVDQEMDIKYSYIKNGEIVTDSIRCKVIGVYPTKESFLGSKVYMTMDIFNEIMSVMSGDVLSVYSAQIYLDDVGYMNKVAEQLEDIGYEVFYESTIEDYIKTLDGFVKLTMAIAVVIMALSMIIMIQAVLTGIQRRSITIGVLKAHGYSNSIVCFMTCLEVAIYGLSSTVISMILCFVTKSKVNEIFSYFMENARFAIDWKILLVHLIIAIGVSAISLIIPIKKMKKINVIDVLKAN